MTEFVSWAMLGTLAGAVALTTALTQVIKHYLTKIDPKWIALAVAMLATVGHTLLYVGDTTAQGICMAVVNGLIVTGASIGLFEGLKSISGAPGKSE